MCPDLTFGIDTFSNFLIYSVLSKCIWLLGYLSTYTICWQFMFFKLDDDEHIEGVVGNIYLSEVSFE